MEYFEHVPESSLYRDFEYRKDPEDEVRSKEKTSQYATAIKSHNLPIQVTSLKVLLRQKHLHVLFSSDFENRLKK